MSLTAASSPPQRGSQFPDGAPLASSNLKRPPGYPSGHRRTPPPHPRRCSHQRGCFYARPHRRAAATSGSKLPPTPYYSLVHTEDPLPGSKIFTRHQRSIQIYQNGQIQHNLLHHRIVHNGLTGRLKTPAVFTRCLSLSFSFLCQIEFRWIKNL